MRQRKFIAIVLAMVIVLAAGAPALAAPVERPQVSLVDSVLAWFGQIAEHLGVRAADEGVAEDSEGAPQASTDETGIVIDPSG